MKSQTEKKIMVIRIGIMIIAIGVSAAVFLYSGGDRGEPSTEKTNGEQHEWCETHIATHINSCRPGPDGVAQITTDGKIVDPDGKDSFQVSKGDTFRNQPDDHAEVSYKTLSISEEGVMIEYTSKFDHRSFGKNLITIDTGRILLKYTTE